MDLHIDVELQGGLMSVTARGNLTFDATLRLLKQVCDTAAEKQIKKILVNSLAVDGDLTTLERYQLGVEIAAYIMQRQKNTRLAFVGQPPQMDGFGVRVAQNRGMTVEVFPSEQEALNWLDIWPS